MKYLFMALLNLNLYLSGSTIVGTSPLLMILLNFPSKILSRLYICMQSMMPKRTFFLFLSIIVNKEQSTMLHLDRNIVSLLMQICNILLMVYLMGKGRPIYSSWKLLSCKTLLAIVLLQPRYQSFTNLLRVEPLRSYLTI